MGNIWRNLFFLTTFKLDSAIKLILSVAFMSTPHQYLLLNNEPVYAKLNVVGNLVTEEVHI